MQILKAHLVLLTQNQHSVDSQVIPMLIKVWEALFLLDVYLGKRWMYKARANNSFLMWTVEFESNS